MIGYSVRGYRHMTGSSKKTGRPYDFYELYCSVPILAGADPLQKGERYEVITCNSSVLTPDAILALSSASSEDLTNDLVRVRVLYSRSGRIAEVDTL